MRYVFLFLLMICSTSSVFSNLPKNYEISSDSTGLLEIVHLEIYIEPCDTIIMDSSSTDSTIICHQPSDIAQALRCSNPDSALCVLFSQQGSHSVVKIVIEVAAPTLVDRVHLKGGSRLHAGNHLNQHFSFSAGNSSNQGIKVELANSHTLVVELEHCEQSVPFYLEARLKGHNGGESQIATATIVP